MINSIISNEEKDIYRIAKAIIIKYKTLDNI